MALSRARLPLSMQSKKKIVADRIAPPLERWWAEKSASYGVDSGGAVRRRELRSAHDSRMRGTSACWR